MNIGHEKKGFCLNSMANRSLGGLISSLKSYKLTGRTGWFEFNGHIFNTDLPMIVDSEFYLEVYGMTLFLYNRLQEIFMRGKEICVFNPNDFQKFIDAKNAGENVWFRYNEQVISSQDSSIQTIEDIIIRLFGVRNLEELNVDFNSDINFVNTYEIETALTKFFNMKATNQQYKINFGGQTFDTMDPQILSVEDVAKRFNMTLEEFQKTIANEKICHERAEYFNQIDAEMYDKIITTTAPISVSTESKSNTK